MSTPITVAAIAAGALALGEGAAAASTCAKAPRDPVGAYAAYDAVFVGAILAKHDGLELVPSLLRQHFVDTSLYHDIRYRLSVRRAWKGVYTQEVVAASARGSERDLSAGREYLIYARIGDRGLSLSACSVVIDVANADAHLRVLRGDPELALLPSAPSTPLVPSPLIGILATSALLVSTLLVWKYRESNATASAPSHGRRSTTWRRSRDFWRGPEAR